MATTSGKGIRRRRREALADAVAGAIASLVSLWTFYPIDVYKTNIQANRGGDKEGNYRGLGVKTLHAASSSFCYFYLYSWILSWNRQERPPSTLRRLFLSAIAAMMNTCITLPLDVFSTELQTQQNAEEKMDEVWKEVDETFYDTTQDEKKDETTCSERTLAYPTKSDYTKLWKGLGPSLLLCSNPSIHYTAFDLIKSKLMDRTPHDKHLTMVEAFAVGLLAKFIATMATYPLIRVKIMLMVTSGAKQKSMWDCLGEEYKRYGLMGWYRGCHLQLIHTMLKSALLMMVREHITETTHRVLVGT